MADAFPYVCNGDTVCVDITLKMVEKFTKYDATCV